MAHLTLTHVEYLDVCFKLDTQQMKAVLTHWGKWIMFRAALMLQAKQLKGIFFWSHCTLIPWQPKVPALLDCLKNQSLVAVSGRTLEAP